MGKCKTFECEREQMKKRMYMGVAAVLGVIVLATVVAPVLISYYGDVAVIQEWLGYCLYRSYPIAKSLLLVGKGRNGKTVLLNVINSMVGPENVSHVSLQQLTTNRFAMANLYNKYVNTFADLPDKAVYETGNFKILTGNDPITAEKKNKPFFNFYNYAKPTFSCNKIPESYDETDAFYERLIIVTCPNQFLGDKADEHLGDKLKAELPWYYIGEREPAPILRSRRIWERCIYLLNEAEALANDSLFEIRPNSGDSIQFLPKLPAARPVAPITTVPMPFIKWEGKTLPEIILELCSSSYSESLHGLTPKEIHEVLTRHNGMTVPMSNITSALTKMRQAQRIRYRAEDSRYWVAK